MQNSPTLSQYRVTSSTLRKREKNKLCTTKISLQESRVERRGQVNAQVQKLLLLFLRYNNL